MPSAVANRKNIVMPPAEWTLAQRQAARKSKVRKEKVSVSEHLRELVYDEEKKFTRFDRRNAKRRKPRGVRLASDSPAGG